MTYEGEVMRRMDRGNRTVRVAQAQLRSRGPLRVETARSAWLEIAWVAGAALAFALARELGVIP